MTNNTTAEVSEAVIEAVAEMRSEAEGAVMCPKKRKWLRLTVGLAERAMQSERLKGDGEVRAFESAMKRIDEKLWVTHGSSHPEALIACLKEIEEIVTPFVRALDLSPPSDGVSRDE